jgi:hypothetical protein
LQPETGCGLHGSDRAAAAQALAFWNANGNEGHPLAGFSEIARVRHQQVIAAIGLVWPEFSSRRNSSFALNRDGRHALRTRALVRALSLQLRALAWVSLSVALLAMFFTASLAAAFAVIAFAMILLLLEIGAAPPARQRSRRIVGDARPLLLNRVIALPEAKRAGRIMLTQPVSSLPPLPPDRPRTRISERRPGPQDEPSD